MIDTSKTLTANDSFQKAEYVVLRMYPLLDGFSVETAGLYIYLRSWRMNDPEDPMYGRVWLSREEIYAQTGIGRKVFERHLEVLQRYGLVGTEKSRVRTNKLNFIVKEPLTEAEFRIEYREALDRFTEKLREIQERNKKDEESFATKRTDWKAESTGMTAAEKLRSRIKPIRQEEAPVSSPEEDSSLEQLKAWL
ncbi:hypothetical protein [Paenibacillus sp.]|uniref:hypothetical protein n=1 Tax=Paenibacillus sp. TaxID=58172 RepID=UPI002D24EA21|nr:hypothetical protein [Paenibacillus sp.]HZG87297.1 hypothetical protein [Paenibacillus sp.]